MDGLQETQALADRLRASEWPEQVQLGEDLQALIDRRTAPDPHAGADQPL
jgi:hypothetical protein